jgi:hypothetical protein
MRRQSMNIDLARVFLELCGKGIVGVDYLMNVVVPHHLEALKGGESNEPHPRMETLMVASPEEVNEGLDRPWGE